MSMRASRGAAVILGVLVGLLAVTVAALHPAAAAQLHVTAAPLQTWKITDLPEQQDPPVDLSGCGDVDDYDEIVYGTADDDDLEADNGRQILVGLAGDDTLSGGNHDDCLVGGSGDDTLLGGNGRDLLFGDSGSDELDGGTGKDLLDAGGDAGDNCTSEGAPDALIGCAGQGQLAVTADETSGTDAETTEAEPEAEPETDPQPEAGSGDSESAPSDAEQDPADGATAAD